MPRTLANPDSFESRLYLPNGEVQLIPYAASKEDFRYMDIALAEARAGLAEDNPAVGAVIVSGTRKQDIQIFKGHSTELTDGDLLSHAEINAYRKAQPLLERDLSGASAYVTVDPCEMCGRIFTQGHIGKLVIAAQRCDVPDFLRPTEWDLDARLRSSGRTILTVFGVRKAEAMKLMTAETKRH